MNRDYREIIRVIYDHSQTAEEGDAVVAALTAARHYHEATASPINLQVEFGVISWRISASAGNKGRINISLLSNNQIAKQWYFP